VTRITPSGSLVQFRAVPTRIDAQFGLDQMMPHQGHFLIVTILSTT
jgi:hypothetical protein